MREDSTKREIEEFKKAQEDANKRRNELITNLEARTKCVGANEFKKGVCGNKGLAHELETGDSEDVEDETEESKKDDSQGQWFLRGKKKEEPDQDLRTLLDTLASEKEDSEEEHEEWFEEGSAINKRTFLEGIGYSFSNDLEQEEGSCSI